MRNEKSNENYIVATLKPWNLKVFHDIIQHYEGNWYLISEPSELVVEYIEKIDPKYVFFPHWSHIVPSDILAVTTCICFHITDLPYGRGGSPLQNLIAHGHRETVVSALRMTDELDAGPVYLKMPLSLDGLAEEIFLRSANLIAEMIKKIVEENPPAQEQIGEPVVFRRKKPGESKLPVNKKSLQNLFDHIRMVDAHGYPRAFLEQGNFCFEFSRPSLKTDEILADVKITLINGDDVD